jgi:hypothetical protein
VGSSRGLDSTILQGQWFLDDASNQFQTNTVNDATGQTNIVTYAHGMRQMITLAQTDSIFSIDDSSPQKIPPGAVMDINNLSSKSIPLYLNSALTRGPVTVANGQTFTANWNGLQWTTNSLADVLPAPTGLAIQMQ